MLPPGIASIESDTFNGCASLPSFVIPDRVEEIKGWAFYACEALSSLVIPDSVTRIGEGAFEKCPALTVVCSEKSYAHQYCEENGIPFSLEE